MIASPRTQLAPVQPAVVGGDGSGPPVYAPTPPAPGAPPRTGERGPVGGSPTLYADVSEAVRLLTDSASIIERVPSSDRGSERTKADRLAAHQRNLEAQGLIERQFDAGNPASVVSALREADAFMEDANWQLARKPSPDGRFTGVDPRGALRDTRAAIDLLGKLRGTITPPDGGGRWPGSGAAPTLLDDVTEAARLVRSSVRIIQRIPSRDTGSESTKADRVRAYRTNLEAQKRIESQFDAAGNPASVVATLREADAFLEDSNWQLARTPSPDGRFTGVDVPGALRDAQEAADLLAALRDQLVTRG